MKTHVKFYKKNELIKVINYNSRTEANSASRNYLRQFTVAQKVSNRIEACVCKGLMINPINCTQ